MRAAIYARYSTDEQRVESIAGQVRACEAFLEREGFERVKIYKDEGISGGNPFRPDYQNLLKDAAEKQFDLIVAEDVSRLWRDSVEQTQRFRDFEFLGIHLIGINDGVDTRREGYQYNAALRGVMNEEYRREIGKRTRRGLKENILNGLSAGGRIYGYDNIPIEDPTRKDQYGRPAVKGVKWQINEKQAAVVRRIFTLYADGHSPKAIAVILNREGIPSPRGGQWSFTSIYGHLLKGRGILANRIYIGEQIWNRSFIVEEPKTRRKIERVKDKKEWVILQRQELRIIADALWARVEARQEQTAHATSAVRERLHKNAQTGAGPKYLFSGLLKCGECGGNFHINDRGRYGCANHRNRGDSVCKNAIRVSRELVETRLLETLKADLFKPEAIELFKKETARLLRQARMKTEPAGVKERAAKLEKQIAALVSAVKEGGYSAALRVELEKAEGELAGLNKRLSVDAAQVERISAFLPNAVSRYEALLARLDGVLQTDVAKARTSLKTLLGADIPLYARPDGFLEAALRGNYAGLAALASNGKISLAERGGFEPPVRY